VLLKAEDSGYHIAETPEKEGAEDSAPSCFAGDSALQHSSEML
jgi:hypothetical protein